MQPRKRRVSSPSLFHGQPRLLPGLNPAIQMIEQFEVVFMQDRERMSASTSNSTMHQVSLVGVELTNAGFEVRGKKVDVRRSGNMGGFELSRRLDIKHDNLLFCDEFLRFAGIDMLDVCVRRFLACGICE